jgi:hypothetical protein
MDRATIEPAIRILLTEIRARLSEATRRRYSTAGADPGPRRRYALQEPPRSPAPPRQPELPR